MEPYMPRPREMRSINLLPAAITVVHSQINRPTGLPSRCNVRRNVIAKSPTSIPSNRTNCSQLSSAACGCSPATTATTGASVIRASLKPRSNHDQQAG